MFEKKQMSSKASIKNSKSTAVIQNSQLINPTFIVSPEAITDIEYRAETINVEERPLEKDIPKNKEARSWVENYLFSPNAGIGKTLSVAFEANAVGTNWNAKYSNLLPLVEFALSQEVLCNTSITGQEPDLYHCITQVKNVATRLKQLMVEAEDFSSKAFYKKETEFAVHIIEELTSEPQFCRLCNIYQLIIRNWSSLKGLSITYRLLSDLARMEKGWKNTPEAKAELCAILRSVSEDWK